MSSLILNWKKWWAKSKEINVEKWVKSKLILYPLFFHDSNFNEQIKTVRKSFHHMGPKILFLA